MNDETEWAAMEAEAAHEQKCWDELYVEAERHNKEWIEKWPNYCRQCGGWGLFLVRGKYSGPPEHCYPEESYPCEGLSDDQCHRCGAHAVDFKTIGNQEELVCRACGWICGQDGLREP